MKCICDYEYEEGKDLDSGKAVVVKGTRPFLKLEVEARYMSMWAGMIDAALYACPNCGTVRVAQTR